MLRLFGGTRASSRTASPAPKHKGIRLQINVPSYGGVFMNRHRVDEQRDALNLESGVASLTLAPNGSNGAGEATAAAAAAAQGAPLDAGSSGTNGEPMNIDPPAASTSTSTATVDTIPTLNDSELSGELEVDVPRSMGRRRCRAIRLTLRNTCRLNMGPIRGWEEDVLFERTIEVKGAIILEPGLQRFNFTIVIPFGLACYDVHPTGRVKLEIIAEVEGLGGRTVASSAIGGMMSPSPSPSPAATPRRGRSPERGYSGHSSGTSTPIGDGMDAPSAGIASQMTVSWADPVGNSEEEVRWLRGSVTASRGIWLMYNPDPGDGVSRLDERRRGEVPGLGPFEVRFMSDVWTVCALLKSSINMMSPSPDCTIYYVRVVLHQTTSIRSPREDPETSRPIVATTPFVVMERGVRPPRGLAHETPALWRGEAAGGTDTGSLHITGVGRLPNDETGRPSTLEGIITPINVTHHLVVEVWYAVVGEDVSGNPVRAGEYAGVRMMKADRPVIVPSCGFIPEVVELPTYESLKFDTAPCPVCGTPRSQQACRTCPVGGVPHSRHDHDPAVVGNANGVCPQCEKRFITDDDTGKWADCACGLSLQKLEERMRSVIPDDDLQDDGRGRQATPPSKDEGRGRRP